MSWYNWNNSNTSVWRVDNTEGMYLGLKWKWTTKLTCLFDYWSRWAVLSTIITALVHFS